MKRSENVVRLQNGLGTAFLAVWLSCTPQTVASTAFAQAPVPDESAQNKALKLVAEVYKADYDRAKTPAQRQALAERMLADVPAATDPANRFALLRVARDVAAEAGAAGLAMRAIDQLAAGYPIDAMDMKLATLKALARTSTEAGQQRSLAEVGLKVVEDAFREDDFEVAAVAGRIAVTAARRGRDAELVSRIVARNREIETIQRNYRRVKAARAILDQKPTDPEANLTVGRYLCFVKGDWQRGVPMLALGSEKPLADVAVRELEGASTAAEQAAMGDAWWELADEEDGATETALRERARTWYAKALPQLTGLVRAKVEKRLQEASSPADTGSQHYLRPANLGNVAFRDYLNGTWNNDIRHQFRVEKAEEGYRLICHSPGGYKLKLVLFPNEDVLRKKLVATLTIEAGTCELHLRPKDLGTGGSVVVFTPGQQHHVELWIEDGLARGTVDGQPMAIQKNDPSNYGYFAFVPSRQSRVLFADLHFVAIR